MPQPAKGGGSNQRPVVTLNQYPSALALALRVALEGNRADAEGRALSSGLANPERILHGSPLSSSRLAGIPAC